MENKKKDLEDAVIYLKERVSIAENLLKSNEIAEREKGLYERVVKEYSERLETVTKELNEL
jgi:hypothetical protein